MKAADEIIADGNRDLGVALDSSKKTVEKKPIEAAQSKIEIGLGQKRQLEERLEKLKCKKAKKMNSCCA